MINLLAQLISIIFACLTKIFATLFYKVTIDFINFAPHQTRWQDVRLIIFLNHTSLFEPLFLGGFPFKAIINIAPRLLIPGASMTLARPIVGRILTFLFPNLVAISRKRDKTWQSFLNKINNRTVVGIAPEGRMKRRTGLDKEGNPMSIKSGVAEIINKIDDGKILIAYSGGLHHVQAPGEMRFCLFKRISLRLEMLDIQEYKKVLFNKETNFSRSVVNDLTRRMAEKTPTQS